MLFQLLLSDIEEIEFFCIELSITSSSVVIEKLVGFIIIAAVIITMIILHLRETVTVLCHSIVHIL